ncbi:hypothetical protein AURDEDRAFT_187022 [Auricularia subglabra TFB-10046 SS5]|nr:hypothetical protein AURDEDRAFT_187022 [Auricularia subglabra TFB-10046 SS5]
MSTLEPTPSVAAAAQNNAAEVTERAYTALVDRQKELWPHASGKNKWNAVKKPNMDIMIAALLDPANGFTTTSPPPKEHTGMQAKRPTKSLAKAKRVTSSQKEDYVAKSVQDGSMRPSAVVDAARKLGVKTAVPPSSEVPAGQSAPVAAPSSSSLSAPPSAPPSISNGEQDTQKSHSTSPKPVVLDAEQPIIQLQDHDALLRAPPALVAHPAPVGTFGVPNIDNAPQNMQNNTTGTPMPVTVPSDSMGVAKGTVSPDVGDTDGFVENVMTPLSGKSDGLGLSDTELADMLQMQTTDVNVLSKVSVSYGDFSQDILGSAWKFGETLNANITVYVHDVRSDEKMQQDINLPVTQDLLAKKTVQTVDLISVLQASLDPVVGTGKISLKMPGSDYLASVALIRDGVFDGKCQRPALELQEGPFLSVSLIVNDLGGSAGLKRSHAPSDGSETEPKITAPKRSAQAATARRHVGGYTKRVKTEEAASESDSGTKKKNDVIVAWLRDELKNQEGYEDFSAQRGSQNLIDATIVRNCFFVKAFVDKYNDRLVSGDIVTGLPKPFKVAKANIWAAFDRGKTWGQQCELIAGCFKNYGPGALQEDPDVVERYNNRPVVPAGFSKLKDFCREVNQRKGSKGYMDDDD